MAAVPRLAVVRCPQWPVIAAGAAPDEAVAVVHANRVVARSRLAAAGGVRVGQRRREAQSRCPAVRIVAHEPARDAREFQQVATAIAAHVPRIELGDPGAVTFVARGPSRYFGGDAAMAATIARAVDAVLGERSAAAGRAGVGVADGRFAAGVAAQHAVRDGAPRVVAPGGSAAFLAPLPVRWLLDATPPNAAEQAGASDRIGLFQRLGVHTLGDLASLPAPDVLARFGREGAAARSMAAGLDDRPPGTQDPPPGLAAVHHADTPIHHVDALVFIAKQLATDLVGALGAGGRVCTRMAVTAETEHGEVCERLWGRPEGFTVGAMVERIRWQLDGWAATTTEQTAGVVRLAIEPTDVRADHGTQLGLWGGRTQADEWAERAIARVAGLVGDEHVVVPVWQGGRQPGDAYRWVPAMLCDGAHALERVTPPSPASSGPWPGALPSPSPAVIYTDPVAVAVADAAGAAVTVSGRGAISADPVELRLGERVDAVVAWAGPWLLEERWWDAVRQRRLARFQLLTASGRAYLATVERQQWWLLAEYA